MFSCQDSTNRS